MAPALDAHISEHLAAISREIWGVMLGEELIEASASTEEEREMLYSGRIEIDGQFRIEVQVVVPRPLLESVTSNLYGLIAGTHATESQMMDLLREVTNLTAGNLKTQIPESSHLSLPVVRSLPPEEVSKLYRDAALVERFSARDLPVHLVIAYL